jgi:hypothetical protein
MSAFPVAIGGKAATASASQKFRLLTDAVEKGLALICKQ